MLIKLNSSLQTKNYLGLSDEAIAAADKDPYYNYIRLCPVTFEVNSTQPIKLVSEHGLEVHRDCIALVQPNPALHDIGSVSFNSHLSGHVFPSFVIRPYKKLEDPVELDWLFELRLLK